MFDGAAETKTCRIPAESVDYRHAEQREGFFDHDKAHARYVRPLGRDGRARACFGRQWQTVVCPPSYEPSDFDSDAPRAKLGLEWAHGYNGEAVGSLFWISDTEFVFPLARLGVVQRLDPPSQKFFRGHSAPLTCLAYSDANGLCASGQSDPKGPGTPFVCIWSPKDCGLLATLVFHILRVAAVGFSDDGLRCFTVGGSEYEGHKLAVWVDFKPNMSVRYDSKGELPLVLRRPACTASAGKVPCFALTVAPTPPKPSRQCRALGKSPPPPTDQFVTYDAGLAGKKGSVLAFWTCTSGNSFEISSRLGTFKEPPDRRPRQIYHCSWSSCGGRCFVCGGNGTFYVFDGPEAVWHLHVCNGPLGFSVEIPNVGFVLAGREDQTMYFGNLAIPKANKADSPMSTARNPPGQTCSDLISGNSTWLTPLSLQDMGAELVCSTSAVKPATVSLRRYQSPQGERRSLRGGGQTVLALVGTADPMLLLFDLGQRRLVRTLTQAHSGESWALAISPRVGPQICATGGTEGTIRFWDLERRVTVVGRVLKFRESQGVWSLAFAPNGDFLAAGHADGTVTLFTFPELESLPVRNGMRQTTRGIVPKGPSGRILDLKFDSRGNQLVAGSADLCAYLYKVNGTASESATGPGDGLTLVHTLRGNTAVVNRVMFLHDGEYVMTNSSDSQILIFNSVSGDRTATSVVQNTRWDGLWTCTVGWPVSGMWAANRACKACDINTCCSYEVLGSNPLNKCVACVLAGGDKNGNICLYRFPAICEHQCARRYPGHGSQVTCARFVWPVSGGSETVNGAELASVGGDDRAMLQWKVTAVGETSPRPVRNCPWVDKEEQPAPMRKFSETGGVAGLEIRHTRTQIWGFDAENGQAENTSAEIGCTREENADLEVPRRMSSTSVVSEAPTSISHQRPASVCGSRGRRSVR